MFNTSTSVSISPPSSPSLLIQPQISLALIPPLSQDFIKRVKIPIKTSPVMFWKSFQAPRSVCRPVGWRASSPTFLPAAWSRVTQRRRERPDRRVHAESADKKCVRVPQSVSSRRRNSTRCKHKRFQARSCFASVPLAERLVRLGNLQRTSVKWNAKRRLIIAQRIIPAVAAVSEASFDTDRIQTREFQAITSSSVQTDVHSRAGFKWLPLPESDGLGGPLMMRPGEMQLEREMSTLNWD